MNIQDRKLEAKQKYDQLRDERNELVNQAQEKLDEMTKLQGEYRLLEELEREELSHKLNSDMDDEPQIKVKGEK